MTVYCLKVEAHGCNLLINRNLEYLNNAKLKVEEIISNGGTIADLSTITIEDCLSDTTYLDVEGSEDLHSRNLLVIYYQLI